MSSLNPSGRPPGGSGTPQPGVSGSTAPVAESGLRGELGHTADGRDSGVELFNMSWSIPIEHNQTQLLSTYLEKWNEQAKETLLDNRADYHWKQAMRRKAVRALIEHAVDRKLRWKRNIVSTRHYRFVTLQRGFRPWLQRSQGYSPLRRAAQIAEIISRRQQLAHCVARWQQWVNASKVEQQRTRRQRIVVAKPRLVGMLQNWREFAVVALNRRRREEALTKQQHRRVLRESFTVWRDEYILRRMMTALTLRVQRRRANELCQEAFYRWRVLWPARKRDDYAIADEFRIQRLRAKPSLVAVFHAAALGKNLHPTQNSNDYDECNELRRIFLKLWYAQAMYQRTMANGIDLLVEAAERAVERHAWRRWRELHQWSVLAELAIRRFQRTVLTHAIRQWKEYLHDRAQSHAKTVRRPSIGQLVVSPPGHVRTSSTTSIQSVSYFSRATPSVFKADVALALSKRRQPSTGGDLAALNCRRARLLLALASWKRYVATGYQQAARLEREAKAFRSMRLSKGREPAGHLSDQDYIPYQWERDYVASRDEWIQYLESMITSPQTPTKAGFHPQLEDHRQFFSLRQYPLPDLSLPPRTRRRKLMARIQDIAKKFIDERGLLRSCLMYWRDTTRFRLSTKDKLKNLVQAVRQRSIRDAFYAWHDLWIQHAQKEHELAVALRRSYVLAQEPREREDSLLESINQAEDSALGDAPIVDINRVARGLAHFHRLYAARRLRRFFYHWLAASAQLRSIRMAGAALTLLTRARLKRDAYIAWRLNFALRKQLGLTLQQREERASKEMQRYRMREALSHWKRITERSGLSAQRGRISEMEHAARRQHRFACLRKAISKWYGLFESGQLSKEKSMWQKNKLAGEHYSHKLASSAFHIWKHAALQRPKERAMEARAMYFYEQHLKRAVISVWRAGFHHARGSGESVSKELAFIKLARTLRAARELGVNVVALLDAANIARQAASSGRGISKEEELFRARAHSLGIAEIDSDGENLTAVIASVLRQSPSVAHGSDILHSAETRSRKRPPPVEGSQLVISALCRALCLPEPSDVAVSAAFRSLDSEQRTPVNIETAAGSDASDTLYMLPWQACAYRSASRNAESDQAQVALLPERHFGQHRPLPRVPYHIALHTSHDANGEASTYRPTDPSDPKLPPAIAKMLHELEVRKQQRARPIALTALREPPIHNNAPTSGLQGGTVVNEPVTADVTRDSIHQGATQDECTPANVTPQSDIRTSNVQIAGATPRFRPQPRRLDPILDI